MKHLTGDKRFVRVSECNGVVDILTTGAAGQH